ALPILTRKSPLKRAGGRGFTFWRWVHTVRFVPRGKPPSTDHWPTDPHTTCRAPSHGAGAESADVREAPALASTSPDGERRASPQEGAHDAHGDDPPGLRVRRRGDVLDLEPQAAEVPLNHYLVPVARDRRVGHDDQLGAIQPDAGEADGRRDVDALGEFQHPLAGGAAEQFARFRECRALGTEERRGGLAGRVGDPSDAPNRRRADRIQPADGARRDGDLRAALAGGCYQ